LLAAASARRRRGAAVKSWTRVQIDFNFDFQQVLLVPPTDALTPLGKIVQIAPSHRLTLSLWKIPDG
jgi:hypothetical protein